MHLPLFALASSASLLLALIALIELGRRIGTRRLAEDADGATKGVSAVEAAIFGLFGLLLAFTFSGAASRFDARRDLIVKEANAIGTAYLRVDMMPAAIQPKLREDFRAYVDARLAFYRAGAGADSAPYAALQNTIWSEAAAAAKEAPSTPPAMLMLPALNDMIDITTTRAVASQTHPPAVIYGLLFLMTLVSALFVGFGMAGARTRGWLHIVGYAVVMVGALYIIMDFEYPRLGIIRVDAVDQVLVDLRAGLR
ncbi:MAG TPA: hypothetical protein VNV60_10630 [Holophagaceae bacterium]|nr:hypothetical protein [Holophagaceae bacterium]